MILKNNKIVIEIAYSTSLSLSKMCSRLPHYHPAFEYRLYTSFLRGTLKRKLPLIRLKDKENTRG